MRPTLLKTQRSRVIALTLAIALTVGFTATVHAAAWPGSRGTDTEAQTDSGGKSAKRISVAHKDRWSAKLTTTDGGQAASSGVGAAVGGAVASSTAPTTRATAGSSSSTGSRATAPTLAPTTTRPAATTSPASSTTTRAPVPAPVPVPVPGNFLVGWTHTQVSADPWHSPAAIASAESVLRSTTQIQNQHIFGWGAMNPEPSPGQHDWGWLDARINLIRRTGSVPVVTLCCAPDWMKGAAPGTTDWARLDVAPNRDRFDDFARLSALVAQRYPDVQHFQVWNEMKGFYNHAQNRWDYEGYTELYNKVYDAVKAVRPDAKLGGPYVVVDTWASAHGLSNPSAVSGPWGVYDQRPLDVIEYWLAHKRGADFLVVDGGIGHRGGASPADPNVALAKFGALHNWIKARTSLPIWWGEFYPVPSASWSESAQADFAIRTIDEMKRTGASVVLLWQPDPEGGACLGCLWYDIKTNGAQPAQLAARLKAWLGR